jgi:two-component sensor histidine kinase
MAISNFRFFQSFSAVHKCFIAFILLILCFESQHLCGQTTKEDWIAALKKEIANERIYDQGKVKRIDSIRQATLTVNNAELFTHHLQLYEEYSLYHFDSAYHYAKILQQIAADLHSGQLANQASIKISTVMLAAGMYKEVFDTLAQLNHQALDSQSRKELYILKARAYLDLADYANGISIADNYNNMATAYLDSAVKMFPANTFESRYYNGLIKIRAGKLANAVVVFRELIASKNLTLRQQALAFSTYSDIFIRKRQPDSAVILLARAAIADLQTSTKENSAMFNLATILYKQNDLKDASLFIQKAASDANIYGAKQRLLQLSTILPLIEAGRISLVEAEKIKLIRYALIITFLFLLLVFLSILVNRQVKKLKRQQKEINQKNISLQHLIAEKEWLLKEIHHRVKNNLHIVSSLLESQAAYLKDEALTAIKNSQHRVFAMSLIHQKLYHPEKDVTSIDMSEYLHELVKYLKDSFETGQRILFRLSLEEVSLNISIAVPLGLIMNEAITNAVKYAFPNNMQGEIIVTIKKLDQYNYRFSVEDNGVGMPEAFDMKTARSLGLKLMTGLSEDINAAFKLESMDGTKISITFSTNSTA